jgi:hypothetical protein
MALPVWQATIVNEFGDIIPSATITVIVESTGLAATLYSDRNGTIPLGTGGVFSANTSGFAQFFADPDNYRVTAEQASSGFSQTWDFVVLSGSAALKDTGAAAGQVPLNSDLGTASTKNAQTSPTDTTADRTLMTDSLDADGNVWGASNVEIGSNANGQYWKYPNGMLVCTGAISLSVSLAAIADNTNFSDQLAMTFPSVFVAAPEVGGRGSVSGRVAWMTPDAITTTGAVLRLFANTSVTGTANAGYVAIGKWK